MLTGLVTNDAALTVSTTTFDSGQATLLPTASPTCIILFVGLHKKASGFIGLLIETNIADGPIGIPFTSWFGSLEYKHPSATNTSPPIQSYSLHKVSVWLLLLC